MGIGLLYGPTGGAFCYVPGAPIRPPCTRPYRGCALAGMPEEVVLTTLQEHLADKETLTP
jgi:hypothetical protein